MLGIFRDHPGIDPEIASLFRDHVLQIRVFLLGVDGFTGINDTDRCFISDHFVTDLIDDICLYQRFLAGQQVFSFVQFIQIRGI